MPPTWRNRRERPKPDIRLISVFYAIKLTKRIPKDLMNIQKPMRHCGHQPWPIIVGVSDPPNHKNSKHDRHHSAHCDVIKPRRFEFLKHERPTGPIKALESSTSPGCLSLVAMTAQTAGTGGPTFVPAIR